MTSPLPCVVCGSQLEPVAAGSWQPFATVFRAHGNYGSGVFDPPWGTGSLAVNICDGCLTAAGEQGRVDLLTMPYEPHPVPVREPWHAGTDDTEP